MGGVITTVLNLAGPPPLGLFNFNSSQFTTLKAAVARVKAGMGRGLGVHIGDSTTWGHGGGDGGTIYVNSKANCWPTAMASRLSSGYGIQSNWENVHASGGTTTVNPDTTFQTGGYKTGLNMASPWTAQGGATTMGGCLINDTTSAATYSYTPEINVDHFELWDVLNTGLGTISYNVDGGGDTNLVQAGTIASRRTVISAGAPGTHTLNLKWVSGNAFIGGFRAWDSTVPAIDWMNVGSSNSKTADWIVSTTPYSSLNVLTNLCATADIVTIELGENDEVGSVAQATYKANYQTIINAAKAGGASVLLVSTLPIASTSASLVTQANYLQWQYDLATTNNLAIVDQYAIYTDYVTLNANGMTFGTGHMNKDGYADFGGRMATIISYCAS